MTLLATDGSTGSVIPMSRVRVAVVFGGRSSEHSISCVSAGSIISALDPADFEVVPVGITKSGRWVHASASGLQIVDGVLPLVDESAPAAAIAAEPGAGVLGDVDVVFPVLHGPWGEDGTVQGLLELANVPYVGSGVMASAVTMDKVAMKAMLSSAGLPVGPYQVVTDAEWSADPHRVLARLQSLGDVLFVKPARAGSSLGIAKVRKEDGPEALRAAIDKARAHDPKVVVEAAIDSAREIECGVLVDGVPRASTCAEIIVHGDHEFYDFEAKYLDDSAELVVPAQLDSGVEKRVRDLACTAFSGLGCEGLARVDFFVRDNDIIVNEVNTMPGFTPISMFPRMWAASGMDYPALVRHLVQDALRRGTGLR